MLYMRALVVTAGSWTSTPRFCPPCSSTSWTRLEGAMTSCPISGIRALTIWWARPSSGTKTDQTASPSFRLGTFFPASACVPLQSILKLGLQLIRPVSRVGVQTGNGGGSLSEESEKWEQQVPDWAEAELQPAGGGVEALEGSPQAPDQREGSLGQSVREIPLAWIWFIPLMLLTWLLLSAPGFSQRWSWSSPAPKPTQRCVSSSCPTTTTTLTATPAPRGTTWVCDCLSRDLH